MLTCNDNQDRKKWYSKIRGSTAAGKEAAARAAVELREVLKAGGVKRGEWGGLKQTVDRVESERAEAEAVEGGEAGEGAGAET